MKNLSLRAQALVGKYFSLYVLSSATYLISSTFYILFIIDRLDYAQFGLVVSIGFIFRAIIDYPTGVIADWLGHKYVLFFAYLAHSISFTMLAFLNHVDQTWVFSFCIAIYIIESFALAQESGALQAWFDNNYKIAAGNQDPKRETYKDIFGKSIMVLRLLGGIAIIFGGLISSLISRETVFILQAALMLMFAFVFLNVLDDIKEMPKTAISLSNFGKLLYDGFVVIFQSYSLFFFVVSYIILIVTNLIWVNLIIYPLYFGYTGTDSSAALLRSFLFIFGAFVTYFGSYVAKKLDLKTWLPFIIFLHSIFFYGFYALILHWFPYENELNRSVLYGVFFIAMIGNFLSTIWMLLFQRFMVDVIPDRSRNSFYSLIPTIALLVGSVFVSIIAQQLTESNIPKTIIIFLSLPTIFGSVFLYLSMRGFTPVYQKADPIMEYVTTLNTTMVGLEVAFGIVGVPKKWRLEPVIKESLRELLKVALEDGQISGDEHILLREIISDLKKYSELLENAVSDGILDFTEHQLLVAARHNLRDKAYLLAMGDEVITQEEQALLDKLTEIIDSLEKFERR
ncbi:MAG: MFS transporter [Candidatus Kariarchaeaceae archaeon]